jgi:tRNA dimethylallyltransferase
MSNINLPKIIVVLGPTASGKTKLAVSLARKFNGEIVSADSRQIYKEMDIGTGKDFREYSLSSRRMPGSRNKKNWIPGQARNDNSFIPYHLIDIINPNTEFNVAKYKKLAIKKIYKIVKLGKLPILVGGTGLYISAIVDNYDLPAIKPNKKIRQKLEKLKIEKKIELLKKLDYEALKFIDIKNPRRIDRALEVCLAGYKFSELRKKKEPIFNILQLGLALPKNKLQKNINARVDSMIKNGLIEETKKIIKKYQPHQRASNKYIAPLQTIGYKEIIDYLQNKKNQQLGETTNLIKIHTRQFAKRQMTWFVRDKKIKWIKSKKEAWTLAKDFLKNK